MAQSNKKAKPQHPLLDTRSTHPPHSSHAPTTFDKILPTMPNSSEALIQPDLNPPAYSFVTPETRKPRLRDKLRLTRSSATSQPTQRLQPTDNPIANKSQIQEQLLAHYAEARKASQEYRTRRQERIEAEQKRNRWLGGLAWGFDPEAGHHDSDHSSVRAGKRPQQHTALGEQSGADATSNCAAQQRKLGIESGAPTQEGNFEYGLLKQDKKKKPR